MLRKTAPPEAARLLPESDAIVYANLKPLRAATHFDRTPVSRSPDYQHFVDATGIVPERDLDAAAFALHRMDDPNGPNGPVAYSEVFEGRFDGERLARYLAASPPRKRTTPATPSSPSPSTTAAARPCASRSLATTPSPRRTCPPPSRFTPCSTAIARRHRRFSGSSLLAARYRDVPAFSSAWGIGHVGLPFSDRGRISIFGLELPLPEDTTFVASLRYLGTLHLRVEQIAPTEADAAHASETLTTAGAREIVQHTQAQMQPSRTIRRGRRRVDRLRKDRTAQGSRGPDRKHSPRPGEETRNPNPREQAMTESTDQRRPRESFSFATARASPTPAA